jgi:phthalate 4,5-cis-dihydrodiol dehydrogenase
MPVQGNACGRRALINPVVRIGVCGLGRAFLLTAPALMSDPRVRIVAAAEPRVEARARFEADFNGRGYEDLAGLCGDPDVDLVYVASPHALHAIQAIAAARAGKHVLVEKPMALELGEAARMIAAAEECGVKLIVGPSHGFDAPVLLAGEMVASGEFGAPRMVTAMNYTDFVYRPRRPEELDPDLGGGVVFNQAPHQIDIVRTLMGSPIRGVRAVVGDWDPGRSTEGAYNAFLSFENGGSATLAYSGYGRFDSDEFCGWIGEMGTSKDPGAHARTRRSLREDGRREADSRLARTFGPAAAAPETAGASEHFGVVVVSCDRADLRTTPEGVIVYGEDGPRLCRTPAARVRRSEVVDEICGAVVDRREPVHSGQWGMATLHACLAIRQSSREHREINLPAA